ncbi:hypothetical protein [Streptomyces qinglanensis]|uniref:Uncharacterized protein n=2 Tax=Streptomyces TaxID=1883 RepID=A0A1H9NL07_9ACTN|nr:hypothetical protein SAMN05421870_101465 [Streptomyces qinglanensis]
MTAVRSRIPRSHSRPTTRTAPPQQHLPKMSTLPVLPKKPLPPGRPREWYEAHNRRLKAMRIAIALLDTGVHTAAQARNRTIRTTAHRIGVHPPSLTTCRLVRSLLP